MANQADDGYFSPWLQKVRTNMATPYLNGSILDIGCGNGYLAQFCSPERYHGYEIDPVSINSAIKKFPQYRFSPKKPESKFDTIVLLAVIEHIANPEAFVSSILENLKNTGRVIITTPHPSLEWVHFLGAKAGLFSFHADEEHEQLFTRKKMTLLAEKTGLKVIYRKRFLFGANQIFILNGACQRK